MFFSSRIFSFHTTVSRILAYMNYTHGIALLCMMVPCVNASRYHYLLFIWKLMAIYPVRPAPHNNLCRCFDLPDVQFSELMDFHECHYTVTAGNLAFTLFLHILMYVQYNTYFLTPICSKSALFVNEIWPYIKFPTWKHVWSIDIIINRINSDNDNIIIAITILISSVSSILSLKNCTITLHIFQFKEFWTKNIHK